MPVAGRVHYVGTYWQLPTGCTNGETRLMRDSETITDRVMALVEQAGVLRPRELEEEGIHRKHLARLVGEGRLERIGRGLYARPERQPTEHYSLAQVAKRVPEGVVCLLSALQFHGLTTQVPFEVWVAVDRKARLPRLDYPKLRVFRFSGSALEEGVAEHNIEGVTVRVTTPSRTVADCFKYRNKIGRDVAIEALRDGRRQRRCTNDELWRYAKLCRMTRVMHPYLEAIV